MRDQDAGERDTVVAGVLSKKEKRKKHETKNTCNEKRVKHESKCRCEYKSDAATLRIEACENEN